MLQLQVFMAKKKQNPMVYLTGVEKSYKTDAGIFYALKNIDISIQGGEFVAVIGKSGSGKTTLINMISGIDRPTTGEIIINGSPIHTYNENEMAIWRGKNLGIVFQFFQLLGNLTALENVMLPMDFCNVYEKNKREEKARELLNLVGLEEHAHKLPSMLSGGQQQRVAIARALANDPPILLADEPTGNLDSRTAEHIFEIFASLIAQGKTILMVTHDRDQAKRVERTIILADGEIIEEYLAHIFPAFTQEQLARITEKISKKKYPRGSVLIQRGTPLNTFYMVTKGQVEILLKAKDGEEFVVATYGPGQYFGEIELLRKDAKSVASARASSFSDVEVAEINRNEFLKLLSESPDTKKLFAKEAEKRLKENVNKQRS
jgi:ABC-type lipoprotein export system ATPase subunit